MRGKPQCTAATGGPHGRDSLLKTTEVFSFAIWSKKSVMLKQGIVSLLSETIPARLAAARSVSTTGQVLLHVLKTQLLYIRM